MEEEYSGVFFASLPLLKVSGVFSLVVEGAAATVAIAVEFQAVPLRELVVTLVVPDIGELESVPKLTD